MKTRILLIGLFAVIPLSQVSAGWHEFMDRQMLEWHRNNAWPQPFDQQDRMAVCQPFIAMRAAGWKQQSTLSSYHFDPGTHQLTEAGQLKVRQITTKHPEGFNNVYVVTGLSRESSAIRLDSAQQAVAKWVPEGSLPQVTLVEFDPPSVPAGEIAIINKQRMATIVPPRLPAFEDTTEE